MGEVKDSSTVFRKNSIRDKAYRYLKKKRSYRELQNYVIGLGGDPSHLLRYFRTIGVVEELNGKIWSR